VRRNAAASVPGRCVFAAALGAAALLLLLGQPRAFGQAALNGQSGLINMPDGRVAPDGTLRLGLSYVDPYFSGWGSVSLLPFLEVYGRYTQIDGVTAFEGTGNEDAYGDYKDKEAGIKLRLLDEREFLPSLSIGAQDFFGTGIFDAQFVALSKRIGDFDFTLGYGGDRIDGLFGGLRFTPRSFPSLSLVAEYDAYDYSRDLKPEESGVADRDKGAVVGLEYRWKWLTGQLSYGHDEVGVNAYMSIPLQQKEYVPKLKEPDPYTDITPRPTLAQWQADPTYRKRMYRELLRQDFKAIRLEMSGDTLKAKLTNSRISQPSRSVGRAARIMVLTAPLETRALEITYTLADLPFATYTFTDLAQLQRYFNGMVSRDQLRPTVLVHYADPATRLPENEPEAVLDAFDRSYRVEVLDDAEGDLFSFRTEGVGIGGFKINPKVEFYFNDPSGAFRYDLFLLGSYRRQLAKRLFFDGSVRLTVVEDVSDVDNPSNSTLPHVRSDVAEYKDEGNVLKLERLLLNRYFFPAQRVYARASVGYYEEMFGGAGGQVMYLPQSGKWAIDITADWVKQRDFEGGFGFQDYDTVTSLASLHVKLPWLPDTYGTVRAGRFLAQDEGARFELKRRFRSGIEIGFWYTRTNGDDITSPGSPGDPYYDKGVFMNIPLGPLLQKDSQTIAGLSLAPWTRDVGQMVVSPGDLYTLFERPVGNLNERDGLTRLGDYDDDN
jgi:hypothetical protein